MIQLSITTDDAEAQAMLGKFSALIKDKRALNREVAFAAKVAVQEHLTARYAGRVNRLGGASTGYWKKAIDGTTATSDGMGADVVIRQVGLRLKWYGGQIRASGRASEVTGKPTKFLTIPVHPSAHGKSIADLGGKGAFYIVPFGAGGGLTEGGSNAGAGVFRKTGGKATNNDPLYWILKRSVTIKPDKQLFPESELVGRKIVEALQIYLKP